MSGPTDGRRELALVALAAGAVSVLHLAVRGAATAAAVTFLLTLATGLAWGVARALARPRLARGLAAALLVLGAGLALQPSGDPGFRPVSVATLTLPDRRARAFEEIAPPAGWRGRGEVWAYVGVQGDMAAVVSARPVLAVEGRPLDVSVAAERACYLRARVPGELLGDASVDVSFGFEAPSPGVGLACRAFGEASVPRVPSRWSADGAPPPRGAPLVPRARGLLARLAGQCAFETPAGSIGPGLPESGGLRYVIELWLLDAQGAVLETCY